jgi:predicted dehydrogenase
MQENTAKKVRAALLGLQHPHSRAHLRTLQQLPEVEEIVLWDPDADPLAKVRAEEGKKIGSTTTDLDTLMADQEWSFAIVAVRNDLGPDIFTRVVEGKRHLLAEKPIGRNATETQRVLAAAKANKMQVGVCYMNRTNPVIAEARCLVGQGLFGPLMSVEMRTVTTQVHTRDPNHWLFKQAYAGGGMISWLGCHYLDMMRFLTYDEIVSVYAETATRSGENIDVEDVAALAVRFRSGAVGTLHTGYVMALSGGGYHNPSGKDNYVCVNGRLGRFFFSSKGTATEFFAESTHPAWASAPQRTFRYDVATSPAYGGVPGEEFVRQFILSTQGIGELPASGADALQIARIVDAAYESNRTGRRVEIATPS